ncbi:MinD/ParA family protein [Streptomyces sp. NPDC016845]|uniref:MinD/ParA family protein n=1 Tax=Streptomyces sp. NPDC016845 TaxID=3364972 RepID=UPI0037B1186E
MAVVAVVGLPGAPGATTSALALQRRWPVEGDRRVLLAECDPDGGSILAGALEGRLQVDVGLRHLAVSLRGEQSLQEAFWKQLVRLSDDSAPGEGRQVLLPGLTSLSEAAALAPEWPRLAELLVAIDRMPQHAHDVLIDLGRNGAFGPSRVLVQRADLVLLVVRGTVRSVSAATGRLPVLRQVLEGDQSSPAPAVGVLLVDEGVYGRREIEQQLGVPVVAVLPYRPVEAAVLSDGAVERKFAKSPLMQAAADAVTSIRQHVAGRRTRLYSPVRQRLEEVRRAR